MRGGVVYFRHSTSAVPVEGKDGTGRPLSECRASAAGRHASVATCFCREGEDDRNARRGASSELFRFGDVYPDGMGGGRFF